MKREQLADVTSRSGDTKPMNQELLSAAQDADRILVFGEFLEKVCAGFTSSTTTNIRLRSYNWRQKEKSVSTQYIAKTCLWSLNMMRHSAELLRQD